MFNNENVIQNKRINKKEKIKVNASASYVQVYPYTKYYFKIKNHSIYDGKTNEIKKAVLKLSIKPNEEEIEIGKYIAIFSLLFIKVFNQTTNILNLHEFLDPNLYLELKKFFEKHNKLLKEKKLFSNNMQIDKVIFQKNFLTQLHFITYVKDNNSNERFFCIKAYRTDDDKVLINNIQMLIGNTIKKFGN
jgi:hypothetical protein